MANDDLYCLKCRPHALDGFESVLDDVFIAVWDAAGTQVPWVTHLRPDKSAVIGYHPTPALAEGLSPSSTVHDCPCGSGELAMYTTQGPLTVTHEGSW